VNSGKEPVWLNDFLFWDAMVVACFIAVDWWLGNRQRKKLLRKCRSLFADFRKRKILPIYRRHAAVSLSLIERSIGSIGSKRFFGSSALVALLPTLVVLTLVSLYLRQDPEFLLQFPGYGWTGTAKTIACNAIAIYMVFCLSVLLATKLLRATRRLLPSHESPGDVAVGAAAGGIKLVGLAMGSACLLALGMLAFLWVAESLSHHPNPEFADFSFVVNKVLGTGPYYATGHQLPHYRWTTGILVLLAIAPLLIHLLLSVLVLIGRAASMMLNRVLSVLLLRVSQGEQGVLRQAALSVGAVAKLIEMGVKAI